MWFFRKKLKIDFVLDEDDAFEPVPAAYGTSAGFDLKAYKDVVIPKGGFAYVPVGLRVSVPKGYWLEVRGRSSLAFKEPSLIPYHGVWDPYFSASATIKMFNFGEEDYKIERGQKFCQLIPHKVTPVHLNRLSPTAFALKCAKLSAKGHRSDKNFWGSSGKF